MIPAAFRYERPSSVEDAVRLLSQPDAKALAGGQSLLPLMRLRLAEPALLVDLADIASLAGIADERDGVRIGALVRHAELAAHAPWRVLREAALATGDRQVRARGTIGGAVAHADPAGDLPAALLALGAVATAQGPSEGRSVPLGEFFLGPLTTALAADEVLMHLTVPRPRPGEGSAYRKLRQQASGFALAGVGAVVRMENGRCAEARLAVTGVGFVPFAAAQAAERLVGTSLTDREVAQAADLVLEGVDVQDDQYASATYRARMCRALAADALAAARAEALA